MNRGNRQRSLAPEVVQTSAMDCGPASLKCLLDGFGISASYGRLREACQTEVDGTSIDTLEEVAGSLGLHAEQVMLPAEQLLDRRATPLPLLLITRLPGGSTHFVVVWRRHGRFFQVMDPSQGRRWLAARTLLDQAYTHEQALPAEAFSAWARSEGFQEPLGRRLRALGCPEDEECFSAARAATDANALAALDAAARLVGQWVAAGAVHRGREAAALLRSLWERARAVPTDATQVIPKEFWFARPRPEASRATRDGAEPEVMLRGVVALLVRRRTSADDDVAPPRPGSELLAALAEKRPRPIRQCLQLLANPGRLALLVLVAATLLAAAAAAFEGLLFGGLLELERDLAAAPQRLAALAAFALFVGVQLALEFGLFTAWLRLGRQLEVRLRAAFLQKLPHLEERYFQSRPISDMAERAHSLHELRELPHHLGRLALTLLTLAGVVVMVAWLDRTSGVIALASAALGTALPFLLGWPLQEAELRQRTHRGALCQFFLDGLLGLAAVRAHDAERTLRREHEGLLVDWEASGRRLLGTILQLQTLQALTGIGAAVAILYAYARGAADPVAALLLAYWALQLPILGEELGLLLRQLPAQRNAALRLFEPLGAPEEGTAAEAAETTARPRAAPSRSPRKEVAGPLAPATAPGATGVTIRFHELSVLAGGHTVLDRVDLDVRAGEHVAIVGPSGAGKSSLVGVLLGWFKPQHGEVRIDGEPLDRVRLEVLREQTAWVDPGVHLWNRSLLDNVRFGRREGADDVATALDGSEVRPFLDRLPAGLQTALGEAGGMLSGGEGQRVRLARGLCREDARLVILDEPFRGLDRDLRRRLTSRVCEQFHAATLLCVTHDVAETVLFDRVLVVEGGRIVESGVPAALARNPASRYRALLETEKVTDALWSDRSWRRLRVESGRLVEPHARAHP